jgi:hypothetical protein
MRVLGHICLYIALLFVTAREHTFAQPTGVHLDIEVSSHDTAIAFLRR